MIPVKSEKDIIKMRAINAIVAQTLDYIAQFVAPGITTAKLDSLAEEFILKSGAKPNFKNYNGFPACACISLNDIVVHGIPSPDIVLKEGDIVSIDLGAVLDGFHGDAARTFPVGKISQNRQKLIDTAKQCFFEAVNRIKPGRRIGDISNAVQTYAESNGFSVVRVMVGHGIGKKLHEEPSIPNFGPPGQGAVIKKGYCFAIEPMINSGTFKVKFDADGWTCRTLDGSDSAHYENTVLITDSGCEILTATKDLQ